MSVTFSVTIGNVTIEKNHSYCRAATLMKHAKLDLAPDDIGVIKHCELMPAVNNLLVLHQEAKETLRAYEEHKPNPTEISFNDADWYEYASYGLIGLFSLAYSKGMDVHYS